MFQEQLEEENEEDDNSEDKDNINQKTLLKLQKYTQREDFTP